MTRKSSFVLGLMSGTSADAIDVALARISGAPPHPNAKLLNHTSIDFPPQLRKEILRVAEQQPISAGDFSQLNFRLGEAFAEAALAACRRFRLSPRKIALIGSHGQTVFHQGRPVPYLGHPTASTLQIGEPAIIAARTGITTVADFRPADIAQGGQGAPLVPYADYLLYHHPKLGRILLNLGGIANITVIPASAKPSQILAFDTGPANMLIDALVAHFTHGRHHYDKNAQLAQQGRSIPALVNAPSPSQVQGPNSRRHHLHRALHRRRLKSLRAPQNQDPPTHHLRRWRAQPADPGAVGRRAAANRDCPLATTWRPRRRQGSFRFRNPGVRNLSRPSLESSLRHRCAPPRHPW